MHDVVLIQIGGTIIAVSTFISDILSMHSRTAKLVSDKGASNWLTTVPLEHHGFVLHKGAFHDALCLRYGWMPEELPNVSAGGPSLSTMP